MPPPLIVTHPFQRRSSMTTPSTPRSVFSDALSSYRSQTKIDISLHPLLPELQNCDSSKSILDVLHGQAPEFVSGEDDWLATTVNVLYAFSSTLGKHVGMVFTPSNAILTAIGIFLKAVNHASFSQETLTNFFQRMQTFFQRLEAYTGVPLNDRLKDVLTQFMAEVLLILSVFTKSINQQRSTNYFQLVRSFTPLLGSKSPSLSRSSVSRKHQSAINRLDKLIQDEDELGTVETRGKALVGVKSWLSPLDPLQTYNTLLGAHREGTTTWLLENDTYKQWKSRGPLLWISGLPGSGKTVLSSVIIEDIEAEFGRALTAYFFVDRRDANTQTYGNILSSLLVQLSTQSNPFCDSLVQLYSSHHNAPQIPRESDLTECLKKMLSTRREPPIYIILDGLDECPNTPGVSSPRGDILELVKGLIALHLSNLHVCVISRPEIDIRNALEPLSPSRILLDDEKRHKDDVEEFIKFIVNSDRMVLGWRAEDKNLAIDTVSRKADGMFRLASCQLEVLRHSPLARVRDELPFPESLNETYEHILMQIDRTHEELAHRLLQCLVVAIRPLPVEDLAEVLALDFSKNGIPKHDVDMLPDNPEQAVLSLCSSLIAIVDLHGRRVAKLSHVAVKDFLTSLHLANSSNGRLSRYHVSLEVAHTVLAQACLGVLLKLDGRVDGTRVEDVPLVEYAAQHWVDHAQFMDVSSHVLDGMKALFDPTKPQFRNWVLLYDIDKVVSMGPDSAQAPAGALYYATRCGFRDLADHLIKTHSQDVNAMGGTFVTPLHAACYMGHLDIVQLLIDHRANMDALDDQGSTPLYIVLTKGHSELRRLLVARGAGLHIQREKLSPLLHLALENGEVDAVEMLLKQGATVDVPNEQGSLSIHRASIMGNVEIVRLLIQKGRDINAADGQGSAPIHLASVKGDVNIVKLLIEYGADVNVRDRNSSTPLHLAFINENCQIAELLISHGARVDVVDNKSSTPLHLASDKGRVQLVALLIEHGAAVNARDYKGWTPLHVASRCGPADVVEFLIDKGGDVKARNDKGWNPLHVASYEGAVDVVQCLLKRGAYVNAREGGGKTPLHLTKSNKQMKAAQVLLKHGADIYARDHSDRMPFEELEARTPTQSGYTV